MQHTELVKSPESQKPLLAAEPAKKYEDTAEVLDLEGNKRLLLYEVLLEEDACLAQPLVSQADAERILQQGERHKERCAAAPEGEHEACETEFNGGLAKEVYSLMSRAARERGHQIRREIAADVQHIESVKDDDRRKVIDGALYAEIYGEISAERQRLIAAYENRPQYRGNPLALEKEVDTRLIKAIYRLRPGDHTEKIKAALNDLERAYALRDGGDRTRRIQEAFAKAYLDLQVDEERVDRAGRLHAQTQRSALCLSGGGIRSATFNLGILQGLARHGLLERFDYLSTVSGGGFIGGWLTAWIHREGLKKVVDDLSRQPTSPLEPEPQPIAHLRNYSNYLSPKVGLLNADTWTLVATLLRNIFLNWLVFMPILMALLIVPRLWAAFTVHRTFGNLAEPLSLVVGFLAGIIGLSYIGVALPSVGEPLHRDDRAKHFLGWCLLPLVISAAAFVTYWVRLNQRGATLKPQPFSLFGQQYVLAEWVPFALFGGALIAVPWIVSSIYRVRNAPRGKALRYIGLLAVATVLVALAEIISGAALWFTATKLFTFDANDTRLYVTFAVPTLLALWSLAGMLLAGFTSRYTGAEDQEWWARAGAWVLMVIVGWITVNVLVLYSPSWFESLISSLRGLHLWQAVRENPKSVAGGLLSLIVTLYGSFSSKTPANEKEARKSGIIGRLLQIATNLAALVLLIYIVIVLAIITNLLLASDFGAWLSQTLGAGTPQFMAESHREVILHTPLRVLLVMILVITSIGLIMGWLINTNRFSLHSMWRDRIIRAYLGASNRKRRPNWFTGFDPEDNITMCRLVPEAEESNGAPAPAASEAASGGEAKSRTSLGYRLRCLSQPPPPAASSQSGNDAGGSGEAEASPPHAQKLMHVLNLALNLVGGDKLAWQDRKSESSTVSPLHCGSYWLGYRRSYKYGGVNDEAISLGTAVAISGAFVSPNMGYMMTSPIVRLLMTLFNVRFGWWLGNPGRAGDASSTLERIFRPFSANIGTYNLKSPRLSVKPIFEEAFGATDDKSDYVYLSDGGHFENLGLYEMVLRRCRFIVVSDASTDPQYEFGSLAMSIRQIRVDLGVPIELREFSITGRGRDKKGKYCALGTIRYSCVDEGRPEDTDGILIYLKPALIGDEPRDMLNYSQESGDFPQEVIVDQWFSEAQFESYRILGSHIIDEICGDDRTRLTFAAFAEKVREHNRMNFDSFQQEINLAAFKQQVSEYMRHSPSQAFEAKVGRYVRRILGDEHH